MIDLLNSTWTLLAGLAGSVFGIIVLVGSWMGEMLLLLHNDHPRLEGLMVGILFAYFFHHRERNPWLRTLASPLKIIIDVLDIVWDETVEALSDLLGDVWGKILVPVNWVKGKIGWIWATAIGKLEDLRSRVKKKAESTDDGDQGEEGES
jgi:hypothetical protein